MKELNLVLSLFPGGVKLYAFSIKSHPAGYKIRLIGGLGVNAFTMLAA
jgi:hypothetical protein